MLETCRILAQLENTASRNEKEDILKSNKNNTILQKVFQYALNPYYIYGIGKKSLNVKGMNFVKSEFNDIFELLDYLRVNNGGSNETIQKVHSFLSAIPMEFRDWYERIILKDLRIGITEKTVNKIWKDLVPSFEMMQAHKYFDHINKVEGKDFIITQKLDGVRAIIMKDEVGNIKIMSRQGQLFENFVDIEEEAKKLPNGYAYDGEFLAINTKGLSSKELYKETTKITGQKADKIKTSIEYHCFDMLPLVDFLNGKCKMHYIKRKLIMKDTIDTCGFQLIKNVPILYLGKDLQEIEKQLEIAIANKQEGVMVNLADAPYECKRSANILKVKKMYTMDLEIVGFERGDGKYSNTLGAMIVDFKGNKVGVGSGFIDAMRDEIWNNQDKYLGRIAEIQYFEISENKEGVESLRFPIFKNIRELGKQVSYD